MSVYEKIKTEVDELLGHTADVKNAVDAAVAAPNVEQAIVDAVIAALEAQGYIVTAPVAPETETPAEDAAEGSEETPNA